MSTHSHSLSPRRALLPPSDPLDGLEVLDLLDEDETVRAERQAAGRERPYVYQSIPGLELSEPNLCRELEALEVRQRQLRARLYLVREEHRSRRLTAIGGDLATGDTVQPQATPDSGSTASPEAAAYSEASAAAAKDGFSGKTDPSSSPPGGNPPADCRRRSFLSTRRITVRATLPVRVPLEPLSDRMDPVRLKSTWSGLRDDLR